MATWQSVDLLGNAQSIRKGISAAVKANEAIAKRELLAKAALGVLILIRTIGMYASIAGGSLIAFAFRIKGAASDVHKLRNRSTQPIAIGVVFAIVVTQLVAGVARADEQSETQLGAQLFSQLKGQREIVQFFL